MPITGRLKRITARERLALSLLGLFLVLMGGCWWMEYSAERQANLNDNLIAAIYRSNSARVNTLLKNGADPNAREKNYQFSSYGGWEGVFRLFRRESEEERNVRHGSPIIVTAARKGNPDIINLLLKYGANVRVADVDGVGPLLAAAEEGKLEAAQLLLNAGCDINQTDSQGNTPLSAARSFERSSVVRFLIDRGARASGSYKGHYTVD
jgi:ankyrin repeat protein